MKKIVFVIFLTVCLFSLLSAQTRHFPIEESIEEAFSSTNVDSGQSDVQITVLPQFEGFNGTTVPPAGRIVEDDDPELSGVLDNWQGITSSETVIAYVGNPESTTRTTVHPFDFSWRNGVIQTIILESDISARGEITTITYDFFDNNNINNTAPLVKRIYMTITDRNAFPNNTSWIPYDNFVLVWEGELAVGHSAGMPGRRDIKIPLDTPFLYAGRNLAIMTHRVHPGTTSGYWWSGNTWLVTATPGQNRTLSVGSDPAVFNPSVSFPSGALITSIPNMQLYFDISDFGTISGVVTNEITGDPIEGARINLVGTPNTVISGADGTYKLHAVRTGNVSLLATRVMYEDRFIDDVLVEDSEDTELDIVMFPNPHDLVILSFLGSASPQIGFNNIYTVRIRNDGANVAAAGAWTLRLMQEIDEGESEELVSIPGILINSSETVDIRIRWNPTEVDGFYIYAFVDYDLDVNPVDNISNSIFVNVQPAGSEMVQIGTWTEHGTHTPTSASYPFHFGWSNAVSQSIVLESQIGAMGAINQMRFRYNNSVTATIPTDRILPLRLYLATTNLASFPTNSSWLPYSEFTLVWEGEFDIWSTGANRELVMLFDEPFAYAGGNLVVMAHRVVSPNGPNSGIGTGNWWNGISWHLNPMPSGTNRILIWNTDSFQLNLQNPQTTAWGFQQNFPSMRIYISSEGLGHLVGTVKHEGVPLADVRVEIDGTNRTATTNAFGEFEFFFLPEGPIDITAVKHGFHDFIQTGIEIVDSEEIFLEIAMIKLPVVTVSGTVTSSDTGLGIEGAVVGLFGYDDYNAVTNAYGMYSIPDVFAYKTYSIVVTNPGYVTYHGEVEVLSVNKNYNVLLKELAFPPKNFTAIEDDGDMVLTWEHPAPGEDFWFTHSNQVYRSFVGHPNNEMRFRWFNRFSQDHIKTMGLSGGLITKVSVRLAAQSNYGDFMIRIYHGATGTIGVNFDPGVLVHFQPVNNVVWNAWNEIELLVPIPIPANGDLMIGFGGTGVGSPASTDTHTNLPLYGGVYYWSGAWRCLNLDGLTGRFMIMGYVEGAEGEATGILSLGTEENTLSVETASVAQNMTVRTANDALPTAISADICIESPFDPLNVVTIDSIRGMRALTQYRIYRALVEDLADESKWEFVDQIAKTGDYSQEFIDTDWSDVDGGVYVYLIQSVYTNNNFSIPIASNLVWSDMTADVEITLTTSDGESVIGAEITLFSIGGGAGGVDLFYETEAESGLVIIPDVWKATYTLTINLDGYLTYTIEDFVVYENPTEITVVLIERTTPVHGVAVVDEGTHAEITWVIREDMTPEPIWFGHGTFGANAHQSNIGTGGAANFRYGQRFTPAQLEAMGVAGSTLTEVGFWPHQVNNAQWSIYIYTGGSWSATPNQRQLGTRVHHQAIDRSTLTNAAWNVVELTTSVTIPYDQELWILIRCNATSGHPAGVGQGALLEGYGNLMMFQNPWMQTLSEIAPALLNNWNIAGMVSDGIQPFAFGNIPYEQHEAFREAVHTRMGGDFTEPISIFTMLEDSPSRTVDTELSMSTMEDRSLVRYSGSRAFEGFRIYRVAYGYQNEYPENWTLITVDDLELEERSYTDLTWGQVVEGAFVYAVKAVHTNNIVSLPRFSNMIYKAMEAEVTITLQTPNAVEGAIVRLVNNSGDPNHVYYKIAEGHDVVFPAVWKGTYTLTITRGGFVPYTNPALVVMDDIVGYTANLVISTVLLDEGFDATTFPPHGWTHIDQDGDGRPHWERIPQVTLPSPPHVMPVAGDGMAWSRSWAGPLPTSPGFHADNWLVSPQINVPLAQTLTLTYWKRGEGGNFLDHLEILVSTTGISTGAAPAQPGLPEGVPGDTFGDFTVIQRVRSTGAWTQYTVDLTEYSGQNIHIAFRHKDHDLSFLLLDEIKLIYTPAEPLSVTMSSFSVTHVEGSSVNIEWVTAAESNLRGFHVFRNTSDDENTAEQITGSLIFATNTSLIQRYAFVDELTSTTGEYFYWIELVGNDSSTQLYGPRSVNIIEDILPEIPLLTTLSSVFPNPMNVSEDANFKVGVKAGETASLMIFNIRGQLVYEIRDIQPGMHTLRWNGRDSNNREAASGVYFYRLTSPSTHDVRRMVIIK